MVREQFVGLTEMIVRLASIPVEVERFSFTNKKQHVIPGRNDHEKVTDSSLLSQIVC
jgi:hypothetical protein